MADEPARLRGGSWSLSGRSWDGGLLLMSRRGREWRGRDPGVLAMGRVQLLITVGRVGYWRLRGYVEGLGVDGTQILEVLWEGTAADEPARSRGGS